MRTNKLPSLRDNEQPTDLNRNRRQPTNETYAETSGKEGPTRGDERGGCDGQQSMLHRLKCCKTCKNNEDKCTATGATRRIATAAQGAREDDAAVVGSAVAALAAWEI